MLIYDAENLRFSNKNMYWVQKNDMKNVYFLQIKCKCNIAHYSYKYLVRNTDLTRVSCKKMSQNFHLRCHAKRIPEQSGASDLNDGGQE